MTLQGIVSRGLATIGSDKVGAGAGRPTHGLAVLVELGEHRAQPQPEGQRRHGLRRALQVLEQVPCRCRQPGSSIR